jgi:hypothetical protein
MLILVKYKVNIKKQKEIRLTRMKGLFYERHNFRGRQNTEDQESKIIQVEGVRKMS